MTHDVGQRDASTTASSRTSALVRRAGVLRLTNPFLWCAAVVLACGAEVAYLVDVNHGLAAQNVSLRDTEEASHLMRAGDEVLGVTGFDMTGRRLNVKTTGSFRSLIITVSAGCPGCEASLAGFGRLATHAREKGLQTVFVSRDYLEDMIPSPMAHLPGLVMAEPTYRTFNTVKLLFVLQTMVVSTRGRVEVVVPGMLNDRNEGDIHRAIDR